MLENLFELPQTSIWMGILSALGVKNGIHFGRMEWQKRKKLYHVSFCNKGRQAECVALWDTGNQLREPMKGRAVHIVDRKILEELGISAGNFVGLAGYTSLGARDSVIPLYELEQMCVWEDGKRKQVQNDVVAGCAGCGLMAKKAYKVILNVEGIVI